MKVLFTSAVNPYSKLDTRLAPLWPAYLASYAEEKLGKDIAEFVYATGPIRDLLDTHQPDLLGLSSVTQNYEYAESIAKTAASRHIPVVVGGMHISSLPSSLNSRMSAACLGEGEQTFTDLLALFLDRGALSPASLSAIPGVAFNDGDAVIETRERTNRPEIDDLPHPRRALIGYGRRAYVYTARGCPYQCVFCSCTRFWGKVRYASPDYILEELAELIDHGVKVIRFADENFLANRPRLEVLARRIEQEGMNKKVKFSCWGRANDVNTDVVECLKSMNVVSIKLGLESGNDRILKYLKGNVTVEENRTAVQRLYRAGLQVNADFLFGAPDEKEREMGDTYRFIKRSPIAFFDLNIFSPLPGTPVWEFAKTKGLVSDKSMSWSRLNYKFVADPDIAITLSQTMSHPQLSRIHKKFMRLRFWKAVKALPRTPWLTEIPSILWKKASDRITRKFGGSRHAS